MKRAVALLLLASCIPYPDSVDDRANAQFLQAEKYFASGKYAYAAELYAEVIEVRDRIRDAWYKLALCKGKLGREAEGIRLLEDRYLRFVDPGDERALRILARLCVKAGRLKKSVETYRKILERQPSDAGEIEQEINRLEERMEEQSS